ncbi:hypothetical protein MA16_Dca025059 [Dendrobium catenatum]|uniref:Uncharacterized protein n=1 Tax=Dendrobium catenatum TaxID=906689 RepID=A0A2I0VFF2_9ASPA|nr:hypothetical protein MA16_Dca025059 [Dendrobium catenatum]
MQPIYFTVQKRQMRERGLSWSVEVLTILNSQEDLSIIFLNHVCHILLRQNCSQTIFLIQCS